MPDVSHNQDNRPADGCDVPTGSVSSTDSRIVFGHGTPAASPFRQHDYADYAGDIPTSIFGGSDGVLDPDEPGTPKDIVVRINGKTLFTLMTENIGSVEDLPLWSQVTSVVIEGLCITRQGRVIVGTPRYVDRYGRMSFFPGPDEDNEDPYGDAILSGIDTYVPVIRRLMTKYPDVHWVWSLPMLVAHPTLLNAVRENMCDFLDSLHNLKFPGEAVLMDHLTYSTIHACAGDWAKLLAMPHQLWIRLLPEPPHWYHRVDVLRDLYNSGRLGMICLPSFGYLEYHRLPTSHGTYQWLNVGDESAIQNFLSALMHMPACISRSVILMELDTCAVEYQRNRQSFGEQAIALRILPISVVRHRRMHSCFSFDEVYSVDRGSSMLKFWDQQTVISYDSEIVTQRKLNMVYTHHLSGVMLGLLQHDLPPHNAESLLMKSVSLLRAKRL